MEIIFLDSVESTHTYLKQLIKENGYIKPTAVVTQHQTNGLGSRNNSWEGKEGNLFFSFVIDKKLLPNDLPTQSASIYFSYILKDILSKKGSQSWLKWPNDFYLNEKKIGGTITNFSNNLYYCGIGLNIQYTNAKFGFLDIDINVETLINDYFSAIYEKKTWKQIFSKYSIEFGNSKEYKTTIENEKVSLSDAILNEDGSVSIENKKVFSLR